MAPEVARGAAGPGALTPLPSAFQTLNLTNPRTFRDLSKPMGAQTKERKLKFIQRFKEVEKTEGEWTAALSSAEPFLNASTRWQVTTRP